MGASLMLHNIGMSRWVEVITIRTPEDWEVVLRFFNTVRLVYFSTHVALTLIGMSKIRPRDSRELSCLDGAFGSGVSDSILAQFPHLRTVSIDAHSDVYRNPSGRFSYRDVFTSLPVSLVCLEITHAHGPDLRIIEMARTYCPNLETLRLGRCTMFNRHLTCDFWSGFPFDHDAYIASDGTNEYAVSTPVS